ncbi:HTH-type transcriptional regulator MhqR [Paenibacillus sp. CECT 9249]|nr:HTH-type transcriptional regulator MhqR [Paenibacillus sp. CECT 9249]
MPESELMKLSSIFRSLIKMMTQEWNKRMVHNLTFSQCRVLFRLHSIGPMKVSELADALSFTSGAITGITDKLIAAGFAVRTRAEDDRRVVYVEITPKGKEALDEIQEKQQEMIAVFFEWLSDEDRQHLTRIFTQILDKVEEYQKE